MIQSSNNHGNAGKVQKVWILSVLLILIFNQVFKFSSIYKIANFAPIVLATWYIYLKGKEFFNFQKPLGILYMILLIKSADLTVEVFYQIFGNYNLLSQTSLRVVINFTFAVVYFSIIKIIIKKN